MILLCKFKEIFMGKIMIQNDNPNPKHIKRRLIAQRVLGISAAAMLISAIPAIIVSQSVNNDVRDLKVEQNKIYETFESSAEFEAEFKHDFKALSNDYINGDITYDQFEEGLTQIKSQEYVKQVFTEKASEDMTAQIQQLDDQITDLRHNSGRAKASNILLIPFLASASTAVASTIPWSIYVWKCRWKEVDESELNNQNEQ